MHQVTAGQCTLVPYIIKTDLFGLDSDTTRVAAELGRLIVPERRSDPNTRLIEVAFVRLKSTAQRPGPPLVFLAGGPGVSGIDGLRWNVTLPWFQRLCQLGDVIMLDQRGTGLSNPRLDCLERWDLPLDHPGTREEALHLGLERSRSAAAFWRGRGVDLAGYTTEESADDIDALRQALGAEKINLYGASYGSHLALTTLKRHGAHIAHAVIGMVEGLDHTIKLPSTVQQHLSHLSQLAAGDPAIRQEVPDLLGLIQSVLERLEREPVTAEVMNQLVGRTDKVSIGKFDLQLLTASGIGSRRFIAKLPARYYAMSRGDWTWLASNVLERRQEWLGNAMSFVMDCASGVSEERYARVQREAPGTLLEDLINFPFPDIAAAWGQPDLGPAFRAPFTSDVPALFLNGTLDGRTPISNVEEVSTWFSRSYRITIEGGTHASHDLVRAPNVTEAILDFLQDREVTVRTAALPFTFACVSDL